MLSKHVLSHGRSLTQFARIPGCQTLWHQLCLKPSRFVYSGLQSWKFERRFSTSNDGSEQNFNPKRVCLLKKVTRYEFERLLMQIEDEQVLKENLTGKGSDYQGLIDRHDEYHRQLDTIHECLTRHGLQVDLVTRQEYNVDVIEAADAVFTAGGDGTFLMAAAKVQGRGKPVIGINTDPVRSEGKLCLPAHQSTNFDKSLERILNGKFKWMWRNRIRITISGHMVDDTPVSLHDQELMYPEYRYWEHVRENEMYYRESMDQRCREKLPSKVLPILALNEVYIGESLAARVSFYEIALDGSRPSKQKSSGITVCTGTGSTSWFFNINHVPTCSVRQILELANAYSSAKHDLDKNGLCEKIAKDFNNSLMFDPSDRKMAFVVRDPVPHGIFQVAVSRGFCNKVKIRSRMFDAWVAVDGGLSFRFNDGAVVDLEMNDEDALRCVTLD